MDRKSVPTSWWMPSDEVVAESLEGLKRGRLFVVPGLRYKFYVILLRLIPRVVTQAVALRLGRRTGRDLPA
jgi:short-subunit dehydrogenase